MSSTDSLSPSPRHSRSSGMALVVTLAFLALVSVLLLAFFLNVQTDVQTSNSYANGVTVKQLADTAANIVMSQISDGTRGYETPGYPAPSAGLGSGVPDSGKRLAWVSQPGLIRTYDDTGLPGRTFKLYSSDNMVTPPGTEFNAGQELNTEVPSSWGSNPALFTDLNDPVQVSSSDPVTGQITSTPNYPILDPGAQGSVEGFSIANAPLSTSTNPAPMPVRWMYVLADGTMVTPDGGGGAMASFSGSSGAPAPTKSNPIVGRVAFWTDDETCKLNINTASEGVFWDRPWADGAPERYFADNIPRQNEFNRYTGHPATTCLSTVFGSIFPITGVPPTAADLAPYLGQGVTGKPQGLGLSPRANVATDLDSTGALVVKTERLYATVDDAMFTPVVTSQQRVAYNSSKVNKPFLEQSKFFLTANSRAPELNLFGKPRVCLWPIQSSTAKRDAKDQLIAFCTTTAPGTPQASPYYFQRLNEYSGDGVTQFSSPTPSSQDPTADWLKITRNQQLFAYLQNLTSTNIPGFGGNFLKKWANDRDQVLTESFDYIRSSLSSYNEALTPTYDYLPTRVGYPHPGETQCAPITVSSTAIANVPDPCMGFGRFPTIAEAALVFFIANYGGADQLQAYLILEPFNVSPGPPVWSPNVRIIIQGLDQFSVGGTSLGFPANGRNLVNSRVGYSGSGHKTAFMGLQAMLRTYSTTGTDIGKLPPPATGAPDEAKNYPFVSQPIAIPAAKNFSGGNIVIKIYSGYEQAAAGTGTPTQLVQTINMNFPSIASLPMPTKDSSFQTIASRLDLGTSGTTLTNLIRPTDSVQGVEATSAGASQGDLRMQAALSVVPSQFFQSHLNYGKGTMEHSLRTSNSDITFLTNSPAHTIQTWLVKNAPYDASYEPAAANGVNGAFMQGSLAGDWDNGPGNIEDGCYINKADEGNLATGEGSYYNRGSFGVETGATFSPNREIASAVSFGSLPIGVKRTRDAQTAGTGSGLPWQTLLFCRNPAAGDSHPGRTVAPRDHLYLDLFTMPIVEPYAISEPFSTAGKVNLNYQIAPFTYITRSTALRGVLKSVNVTAIGPTSAAATYKLSGNSGSYRRKINLDETMKGFDARFSATAGANWIGDTGAFRSPSEICDMFLVPQNNPNEATVTLQNVATCWKSMTLTGDNAREAPYGQIYPRVTTRSNTFTVHMRVQSLRKSVNTAANVWDETRDSVLGEYRGSTMLERYVDAGDSKIPDFATNSSATMDSYYRFRVIGTKKFAP